MSKAFLFALLVILSTGSAIAATQQQDTYDKEQIKQDYRVFLQQLKSLNEQYKEFTGEMGKVMKEEGVPTWDMGHDLEGGVYLKETEKDMVFTLDLPGYKKNSIKLNFKDTKTLVITAERKLEGISRFFERSFDLPAPGDQKNSVASYEDGVLTVKIPKTASPPEISIPIR